MDKDSNKHYYISSLVCRDSTRLIRVYNHRILEDRRMTVIVIVLRNNSLLFWHNQIWYMCTTEI